MNRHHQMTAVVYAVSMMLLIAAAGCNSDLFKTKVVPVITGISADRYEVNPGDTVQIRVSVQETDDASLQYHWSSDGGQFIPPVNQPEVLWMAPEEGGDCRLTIMVSNTDGDSEPGSEIIHVRIRQAPEILSVTLSAYVVDPGDTLQAAAELKDMNDPTLAYHWSSDGGQFLPPADAPDVLWKAPAVGGTYAIVLVAANDKKESQPHSETVTVRSYAAPYVNITAPGNGDVFLQYSVLEITAEANHHNGIESVSLCMNDSLRFSLNGTAAGMYRFTCPLDGPAGMNTLRIDAVAKITGVTGSDQVQIRVEGIVLGK